MTDSTGQSGESFECVICGSSEHDGEGWIFPTEDTKVVELKPDGVERELREDPRALCSTECKDEFAEREGVET